jgi:hypothetical protein
VKAFDRANDIADAERMEHLEYYFDVGALPAEARDALRKPIVKHGVVANRKTLETAAQMSVEQGLTPHLMKLEDVFAEESMEL